MSASLAKLATSSRCGAMFVPNRIWSPCAFPPTFMKLTIPLLCISLATVTLPAAEKLDATLQKGMFEEEGNQNLEAAIQAYQSLIAAHDNDRKTAATAIYRLGECYRKLGRTNEAVAQFQRILGAFSDQPTLSTLSRQNLAGLGAAPSTPSGPEAGSTRRQVLQQTLAAQRADATASFVLLQRLQNMSQAELRRSLLTVVPDTLLARLLEQSANAEQRLTALKESFSKDHPTVVAETKALAEMERQINDRIGGILEGLKLQAAAAQQRAETLEAELAAVAARTDSGAPSLQNKALDEASRAKMKEMLQQELQLAEQLLAEQKKKVQTGTVAPGDEARHERDVLGVKRQLLAVDGLTAPDDRKQWRGLLVQEIQLADTAAQLEKRKLDAGRSTSAEVARLQRDALALKRELLEFDARPAGPPAAAAGSPPSAATSEEEEEIRKIKSIISNSPDLINTPTGASTPLHQAAAKGQLIVARFLLDNGALVEQRTTDSSKTDGGQTALSLACSAGHKAMAELLLSRGANPNSANNAKDSPLHMAAGRGFVSVAEVLLRNKAQVDLKNASGETPLHTAVKAGQSTMAIALLRAGADANAARANGQTALHLAAIGGNVELTSTLLERGANPNPVDAEQATPLYAALYTLRDQRAGAKPVASPGSRYEGAEVIRLLLEKGASIERAPAAASILHQAVACNSTEIVKMILERHPRIDALNWLELTPLQSAVVDGSSPELIPLLVKAGANVNQRIPSTSPAVMRQRGGGETKVNSHPPLIVAIRRQDLPMSRALLENGADVNAPVDDNSGITASIYALWTKSQEFLDLVLQHKPDLSAQIKVEGKTVLHLALDTSVSAVATLLKAGAPVNAVDFQGRTPLHLVASGTSIELAELLLKNGADPNAMTLYGQWPLSIARAASASTSRTIPARAIRGGMNPNSDSRSNDMVDLLLKRGADELLLRRQAISVTRASRNFDSGYFIKGTNDFNRHSLYELFATVYSRGSQLPFPELRQITIERLQADRSTRNITVDLAALASTDGACTNDIWLEWGDRVEIPEADHALSQPWIGLDSVILGRVAHCLQRNIEIVSKSGTNRYELRAIRVERPNQFNMDSFRLYDVLKRSGLLGNPSEWPPIRVTRKRSETGRPVVYDFNQIQDPNVDLWLRDGDVVEILSR